MKSRSLLTGEGFVETLALVATASGLLPAKRSSGFLSSWAGRPVLDLPHNLSWFALPRACGVSDSLYGMITPINSQGLEGLRCPPGVPEGAVVPPPIPLT